MSGHFKARSREEIAEPACRKEIERFSKAIMPVVVRAGNSQSQVTLEDKLAHYCHPTTNADCSDFGLRNAKSNGILVSRKGQ